MNGQQLNLAGALITLLEQFGPGQLAAFLAALILTPWLVLVAISYTQNRRFEAVTRMYEDNVRLVEDTLRLAADYRRLVESGQDMAAWVGQEISKVNTLVVNNMHCPVVRKNARPRDIQENG